MEPTVEQMFFAALWLCLAMYIGERTNLGLLKTLIVSLIFTPLLAIILALVSGKKRLFDL